MNIFLCELTRSEIHVANSISLQKGLKHLSSYEKYRNLF